MSELVDTWMTPHDRGKAFNVFYKSPVTATLFTPETPKVFCGLKHFTDPSICIVVSRWWVHFHFSVNYPFKWHKWTLGNVRSAPKTLSHQHEVVNALKLIHLRTHIVLLMIATSGLQYMCENNFISGFIKICHWLIRLIIYYFIIFFTFDHVYQFEQL